MDKIEQNRVVRAADPELALDLTVLAGPGALARHLAGAEGTWVLRPAASHDVGSALFHRPGRHLTAAESEELWSYGGLVVAHPYVPGVPHFANGTVAGGRFELTDSWRCFWLDEGPRRMLTSVISLRPDSAAATTMAARLAPVAAAAGITDGPVHFEVVLDGDRLRVVKWAARAAGEPLPQLRGLLGEPASGFAADYSFLVRRAGRLVAVEGLDELRDRPSYHADGKMPAVGDRLVPSSNEVETLTLLLRHDDEATLLADIDHYQQRNRSGIFVQAD